MLRPAQHNTATDLAKFSSSASQLFERNDIVKQLAETIKIFTAPGELRADRDRWDEHSQCPWRA